MANADAAFESSALAPGLELAPAPLSADSFLPKNDFFSAWKSMVRVGEGERWEERDGGRKKVRDGRRGWRRVRGGRGGEWKERKGGRECF